MVMTKSLFVTARMWRWRWAGGSDFQTVDAWLPPSRGNAGKIDNGKMETTGENDHANLEATADVFSMAASQGERESHLLTKLGALIPGSLKLWTSQPGLTTTHQQRDSIVNSRQTTWPHDLSKRSSCLNAGC